MNNVRSPRRRFVMAGRVGRQIPADRHTTALVVPSHHGLTRPMWTIPGDRGNSVSGVDGDLAEVAGLDLVDEAADRFLPRDERIGEDATYRLADVFVDVGE